MLLQPVVLVQHLGIEKLTNAFGLLLIASGLGHLLGPIISGILIDQTGDYSWVFFMSGGSLIFSGLLFLVLIIVSRN
jgi:MFS family permease